MSRRIRIPASIALEYYESAGTKAKPLERWLVDPKYVNELKLAVYQDDDSRGTTQTLSKRRRLQVQLGGTPRSLEALGRYLIAMARLNTDDPDFHDHFEQVQCENGGTVHLIVRRELGRRRRVHAEP